jgi:DNA modification methylase
MDDGTKNWKLVQGDCVEQMRLLQENSVDSVVCDPPYGLEFMGKEWDKLRVSDNPSGPQSAGWHEQVTL